MDIFWYQWLSIVTNRNFITLLLTKIRNIYTLYFNIKRENILIQQLGHSCTHTDIYIYYPNLVIQPVDNNEHQMIDDVSTDRISYAIRSVETMGFAL